MRKFLLAILAAVLLACPLWAEETVVNTETLTVTVNTAEEMKELGIPNPEEGDYYEAQSMAVAVRDGRMTMVVVTHIFVLDGKQDAALSALVSKYSNAHDQLVTMVTALREHGIDPVPDGEVEALPEVESLAEVGQLFAWYDRWLEVGQECYGTLSALGLLDEVFPEAAE